MLRERNTGPGADATALLERPLPARSLIASLLLRTQPPRMRGARLVQWCGLFGVAEGTTRVALSRMVERGELRARDGVYELAGRVQSRQTRAGLESRARARCRGAATGGSRSSSRGRGNPASGRRCATRCAGSGTRRVREGAWTRPDNLPRASAPAESWRVVDEQCSWWSGRPDERSGRRCRGAVRSHGMVGARGDAHAALGARDASRSAIRTAGARGRVRHRCGRARARARRSVAAARACGRSRQRATRCATPIAHTSARSPTRCGRGFGHIER